MPPKILGPLFVVSTADMPSHDEMRDAVGDITRPQTAIALSPEGFAAMLRAVGIPEDVVA